MTIASTNEKYPVIFKTASLPWVDTRNHPNQAVIVNKLHEGERTLQDFIADPTLVPRTGELQLAILTTRLQQADLLMQLAGASNALPLSDPKYNRDAIRPLSEKVMILSHHYLSDSGKVGDADQEKKSCISGYELTIAQQELTNDIVTLRKQFKSQFDSLTSGNDSDLTRGVVGKLLLGLCDKALSQSFTALNEFLQIQQNAAREKYLRPTAQAEATSPQGILKPKVLEQTTDIYPFG